VRWYFVLESIKSNNAKDYAATECASDGTMRFGFAPKFDKSFTPNSGPNYGVDK